MTMSEDTNHVDKNNKLPEGAAVLEVGAPEIVHDVGLALDLARLGASPTLVREVGGENAVREAAAGNGARP
jgi:hypothetical protein